MKLTIKGKEYYLKNSKWYSLNKNGHEYLITGRKILIELRKEKELDDQDIGLGGLGDFVEKVADKLGIKKCAGCEKRRKAFNRAFPWLSKSRELTDEEQTWVISLATRKQKSMSGDEANRLFALYNELTNSRLKICQCSGLVMKMIERLNAFVVIINDKEDE